MKIYSMFLIQMTKSLQEWNNYGNLIVLKNQLNRHIFSICDIVEAHTWNIK